MYPRGRKPCERRFQAVCHLYRQSEFLLYQKFHVIFFTYKRSFHIIILICLFTLQEVKWFFDPLHVSLNIRRVRMFRIVDTFYSYFQAEHWSGEPAPYASVHNEEASIWSSDMVNRTTGKPSQQKMQSLIICQDNLC